MSNWTSHWLTALGDLGRWRAQIISEIEAARAAVSTLVETHAIDILIQRVAGAGIPEIGMVGHAYRKNLFALTFDPDNANFDRCVADATIRRQVTHEVHHCLRRAGPGYGRTLGEALVSEGLAGQFTRRLFGNPPEPWERACNAATLRAHHPTIEELLALNFDHAAWFYGSDGRRPRWLGYTLGYELAGQWLAQAGDIDAVAWISVPARTVLATGWPEIEQRAD